MEKSSQAEELPTLIQHIQLVLWLIINSPNREFYKLYALARDLIGNSQLRQVTQHDIEYLTGDFIPEIVGISCDYCYQRVIISPIGKQTMRWFVETQITKMITLSIKLSSEKFIGINDEDINIQAIERLVASAEELT